MNDSTFKMEASEEVKVQLVDVMGQGRFRNFRDFDNKKTSNLTPTLSEVDISYSIGMAVVLFY